MRLFKYFPDNINSFKSLGSRGLWCHFPLKMNDPFECLGFIDRNISIEQINSIRSKYKNSTNLTVQKMINFSNSEFIEFTIRSRTEAIKKFAFCSFSKTFKNILMWSHYASSHTGFVLEFAFDDNILDQIYEVKYLNKLPEFDLCKIIDLIEGDFENRKDILSDISIKFQDWQYEQEFRLWRDAPGYFFYPKHCLKSIIFGINCSSSSGKAFSISFGISKGLTA